MNVAVSKHDDEPLELAMVDPKDWTRLVQCTHGTLFTWRTRKSVYRLKDQIN
jgi:hypothetical protein